VPSYKPAQQKFPEEQVAWER